MAYQLSAFFLNIVITLEAHLLFILKLKKTRVDKLRYRAPTRCETYISDFNKIFLP